MSPELCPICATDLPGPTINAPDRLHGTRGQFAVSVCPGCGAGVTVPRVDASALQAFYPGHLLALVGLRSLGVGG